MPETYPFLTVPLKNRTDANALRRLSHNSGTDFSSNDYLGFAKDQSIAQRAHELSSKFPGSGATGSRLISGNSRFLEETEQYIADYHQAASCLIFNSGYDANVGLFSCVPRRGDTILYDYLIHASVRDGIRLSNARAFSFLHNDIADLEKKLKKAEGNIFVAVEALYSMDGDNAPLAEMAALCEKYGAHLIVDEAHSTGVSGPQGRGAVVESNLTDRVFARLHTFGKAIGVHGAAWLGNSELRNYLINFARPLIYSTALPGHTVAAVRAAYEYLPEAEDKRKQLRNNISHFCKIFSGRVTLSASAIQSVIIPGNREVLLAAARLHREGFSIRPIRYPTVPEGEERLRIILHSYNSEAEISALREILDKGDY